MRPGSNVMLCSIPPDVKHLRSAEFRDGGFEVFRKPATNLRLDECQLAAKPLAFALGALPGAFGLRLRASRRMDARCGLIAILLNAPEGRSSEFVTLSHRL